MFELAVKSSNYICRTASYFYFTMNADSAAHPANSKGIYKEVNPPCASPCGVTSWETRLLFIRRSLSIYHKLALHMRRETFLQCAPHSISLGAKRRAKNLTAYYLYQIELPLSEMLFVCACGG